MSDPTDEPLEFENEPLENAPLSAEQQEEFAKRLAPCSIPVVDTSGWRRWDLDLGAELRLPQEYVLQESPSPAHVVWQGPDSTMLFLFVHRGDGRGATGFGFDEEPEALEAEDPCAIEMAGRTAALLRLRFRLHGQLFYSASVDAAVRDGFGLSLAVLTTSPERRLELIAAATKLEAGG